MRRTDLPERLADLPPADRVRLLKATADMTRFAFQRTAIVCVASESPSDARFAAGSGFVLRLGLRDYLGTAWSVVRKWQEWTGQGDRFQFQAGALSLRPSERIAWKDEENGLAFLRLWPGEGDRVGVTQCDVSRGWPPPLPKPGSYVLVSGYPGTTGGPGAGEDDLDAFSALLQVSSADTYHFDCQVMPEHWTCDGHRLPTRKMPLGGMSGGPALMVGDLANPLVGLVSGFGESTDTLRVHTLFHAPARFD